VIQGTMQSDMKWQIVAYKKKSIIANTTNVAIE